MQAFTHDIVLAQHTKGGKTLAGVFCLRGEAGAIAVDLPDGQYRDLISGGVVEIRAGRLGVDGEPVIFEV